MFIRDAVPNGRDAHFICGESAETLTVYDLIWLVFLQCFGWSSLLPWITVKRIPSLASLSFFFVVVVFRCMLSFGLVCPQTVLGNSNPHTAPPWLVHWAWLPATILQWILDIGYGCQSLGWHHFHYERSQWGRQHGLVSCFCQACYPTPVECLVWRTKSTKNCR